MITPIKIAFCGHSQIFQVHKLEDLLYNTLKNEINKTPVEFYLSCYGDFDNLAIKCCLKFKKEFKNVKLYYVTPYINDSRLKNRKEFYNTFDEAIYPNLEKVPLRYAIIECNKWKVKQANLVISYVDYSWGGAAKMLNYAHKTKTKYINLGCYSLV